MPTFVIKYVQDHSLKDSVHAFLKAARRLNLPPTPSFVSWARTRAEARAATAALAAAGRSAEGGDDGSAPMWRRASAALEEATQLPAALLLAALLAGVSSWAAYAYLRCQQRRRERQRRRQKATPLTPGNTPWWFSYTTFRQRLRQRRAAMRTSRELRRMRHRLSDLPGKGAPLASDSRMRDERAASAQRARSERAVSPPAASRPCAVRARGPACMRLIGRPMMFLI